MFMIFFQVVNPPDSSCVQDHIWECLVLLLDPHTRPQARCLSFPHLSSLSISQNRAGKQDGFEAGFMITGHTKLKCLGNIHIFIQFQISFQ